MSNKKFLAIWVPVLSVLVVAAVTANILLSVFGNLVSSQLGAGTYEMKNAQGTEDWDTEYYTADYDSKEATEDAAVDFVEKIEAEGIVLAKNDGTLPLAGDATKVTLLGRAAADPVYGGAGSGSFDPAAAVNFRAGLENAGLEVNDTVYSQLSDFAAGNERGFIKMDLPSESSYAIGEMPVDQYSQASVDSFADYSDAAVVVLARPGGEGGDLATDMQGWDDNYTEGQHQLELNKDEKDLIALAEANFETVVVVVNASTSMELGAVQDDPGVDSVLLIGSPGQSGLHALGKVLTGEVNPSGRTVDLFASDFTQDPTFVNFGDFTYSNVPNLNPDGATASAGGNVHTSGESHFVQYEEGIYVGYRYYETAAVEGFIDYDQAVVYPFGYGLSYTTFSQEITGQQLGAVDGEISVDVTVTNTGDVAGKQVVQLYYSAPYTPGGIEKSAVVLGTFDKTEILEPGQSETVTLSLAVEDMASYDYAGAAAYVLDAGDYTLTVQDDSHTVTAGTQPITYTVDETVTYSGDEHRASDQAEVTNQFDDVSAMFSDTPQDGKALTMSRADFAGTFPTAPTAADTTATDEIIAGFAPYDIEGAAARSDAEMPTQGAEGDLSLIDLRGLPYDDPTWDDLLDQISVDEMASTLINGAYNTPAINSISKPVTGDYDGPAGFSSFINNAIAGVGYTSEYALAQTWNVDLAYEMGVMVGNEALALGANGWYAPAMNIHRSPFAGRNFEYYSEDGFLSGELGLAVVDGAATKGVYSYIKHFAMNDQETNRVDNGPATWATEQTIREIYLKPFEITLKNATHTVKYVSDDKGTVSETEVGATAVMSSFNRIGTTWAGGSKALMTNVLRGEWGFEGMGLTDWNLYGYMYPEQAAMAGTDLSISIAPIKSWTDKSSAESVSNMRKSMHSILFTVVNSNAMNDVAPGAQVEYTPPTWRYIQVAADVVLGLLLIAGAFLVIRRVRSHRAAVLTSGESTSGPDATPASS